MATCPEAVARRLDLKRGLEIVRIQFNGEWIRGLNYVGEHRNEEGGQEEYRKYLAHYAGYPEEEWRRIKGIKVVSEASSRYPLERCIELEVEFANVGKCLEFLVLEHDHVTLVKVDGKLHVGATDSSVYDGQNYPVDVAYTMELPCDTIPTSPT